ncbi:MAG TPA: PqiC family protein [Alphaproteobacteria bacterium]|jgi:hypothetical protein
MTKQGMVRASFAAAALLALAACVGKTEASRFYVLSATAPAADRSPQGLALSVGPVALPKYLDRQQIVTRPTANELAVAEFDRWGGRLEDNVTQVIGENLSRRLHTSRVKLFPTDGADKGDLRVTISISRFECVGESGDCVLDARWQLASLPAQGQAAAAPIMGASGLMARPMGIGYASVAATMSGLLDDLSREIAASIVDRNGR